MRSERRLHWSTRDYFDLEAHSTTRRSPRSARCCWSPSPNAASSVEHHRRVEGDRWVAATFTTGTIELALGVSLVLADVYDQIESSLP